MSKKNKKTTSLSLTLGILGFLAGIGLMFSENYFIGIFGSIASAGLAYKGYQERNN
ncbi:MAG: ABC-type transport system involved in cytochrome bd biosynthesis fused ATPase/permease subunit [Salibacteraceae bacterium]|jgi:ABC-type transport system involved in cytochrome bd biosynthesis fused ATPase/permease subunit